MSTNPPPSQALAITDWAMLLPQMIITPGLISYAQSMKAGKNSWLAIGIWGMSMTFIKVSIALTLLRIQQKSLSWRIFLYSIMAVQALYGVLNLFFNLLIACRPLAAAWDFNMQLSGAGTCVSYDIQRTVSNVGSSVNITTDLLLALAPVTFLFKLNRPLRERIFVCGLMAMGIFASVASIIKTLIVRGYGDPNIPPEEFWPMGVAICTWTALEQLLGVLAACVPAMKNIFQLCLGKMGVSLNGSRPGRSGYYIRDDERSMGTKRSTIGTGTFQGSRSRDADEDVIQMKSRFEMRHINVSGKEVDSLDEDEECLDTTGVRRGISTPKSGRTGSQGSFHHGTGGADSSRGFYPSEQLPAHAV